MRLSDLQKKDIINVFDGSKIGKVIDIEFNAEGIIEKIIIEKSGFMKSVFSSDGVVSIGFYQIKKLGEDVIMVELT